MSGAAQRNTLTAVWLVSFVAVFASVEVYFLTKGLTPDRRADVYRPLAILYGAYLGVILGAWFIRPFPALRTDGQGMGRFVLALVCTLLWNGAVLYHVSKAHLEIAGADAIADIGLAVTLAGWTSFLVGPVNLYYFGAIEACIDNERLRVNE